MSEIDQVSTATLKVGQELEVWWNIYDGEVPIGKVFAIVSILGINEDSVDVLIRQKDLE